MTINLASIGKKIQSYTVVKKERDSIESGMISSDYGGFGSENSANQKNFEEESSKEPINEDDKKN